MAAGFRIDPTHGAHETGREKGAKWLCRDLKFWGPREMNVRTVTSGDKPNFSARLSMSNLTVINQGMDKAQRKVLNGGPLTV